MITVHPKLELNNVTNDITNKIKDVLGDKIHKIILYGSYARGDYDSESDIDMMILADIEDDKLSLLRSKINKIASRVGLEHDIMISISLKDKNFFEEHKNILPFYYNVDTEGVELYGPQ